MPTVPTIDLSNVDDAAIAAIDQACLDHGFFKVKGHGFNDAIDEMWREARRFFALPRSIKQSVMRQPDRAFGYFDRELTKRLLFRSSRACLYQPLKQKKGISRASPLNRAPLAFISV